MTEDPALPFRVKAVEARVERLEGLEAQMAVAQTEIRDIKDDLHAISDDLKSFRMAFQQESQAVRALLTRFFVSLAGILASSVIYVLINNR